MDRPRYVPFVRRIPPRPRYTICLIRKNAVRSRRNRRLLSTPTNKQLGHTSRTPPRRLRQTQTGESTRCRQMSNAGWGVDNHCGTSRLRLRVFVPLAISVEFGFEFLFLCRCSLGSERRTLMREVVGEPLNCA